MIEQVSVVCPNCKQKLSFIKVPNWQEKDLKCPHCQFKAKANVYLAGAAAQGGRGGSRDDDPSTQLASDFSHRNSEIGVIRLVANGRCFQLRQGTNVLGRLAQSSKADQKISSDPYMSRQHLRIDVVKTAAGFEHRLVEIDSKNVIVLNGRPIQRGDILKLNFGDRLVLGQTEVIFDRPTVDDEEPTQLL